MSKAKKTTKAKRPAKEIVTATPLAIFGGGRAAQFDSVGRIVKEGPVGAAKPVAPDFGVCDVCGCLSDWMGKDVACDNDTDDGPCDGTFIPSDENGTPL